MMHEMTQWKCIVPDTPSFCDHIWSCVELFRQTFYITWRWSIWRSPITSHLLYLVKDKIFNSRTVIHTPFLTYSPDDTAQKIHLSHQIMIPPLSWISPYDYLNAFKWIFCSSGVHKHSSMLYNRVLAICHKWNAFF